jgi:hypothetical protein
MSQNGNPQQNDYRIQKQLKEQADALYYVIKDYPDLEDLRELYASDKPGDKQRFLFEYPRRLVECVAKDLSIPKSGVDILGGKPYINKTGLTYKIQRDKRKIKTMGVYPVLFPFKFGLVGNSLDEEHYKYFLGSSEDGTAVFMGIVEFANGEKYFDYGTANAKYLCKDYNKMSTMQPYVIELASTRANLRTIRIATGVGLCSVEEMNDKGYEIVNNLIKSNITPEKQKLMDTIESQFKQLRWNSAKKLEFCNRFGGDLAVLPDETLSKIVVELSCKILENKQVKKTKKVSAKNETKVKSKIKPKSKTKVKK